MEFRIKFSSLWPTAIRMTFRPIVVGEVSGNGTYSYREGREYGRKEEQNWKTEVLHYEDIGCRIIIAANKETESEGDEERTTKISTKAIKHNWNRKNHATDPHRLDALLASIWHRTITTTAAATTVKSNECVQSNLNIHISHYHLSVYMLLCHTLQ